MDDESSKGQLSDTIVNLPIRQGQGRFSRSQEVNLSIPTEYLTSFSELFVTLYVFQDRLFDFVSFVEIPSDLKIQPKIRRHMKEFGQTQSCTWCDPAFLIDELVDALVGHLDGVGQFTLGDVRVFLQLAEYF